MHIRPKVQATFGRFTSGAQHFHKQVEDNFEENMVDPTEQGKPRPRVLIIGLDGGTFDLIRPWAEQGSLPTLSRLMKYGNWGELKVELPPGTVPNWPTFATGKNPGKHGLIWWVKPDRKADDYSIISSVDLHGQTLWDIVGRHGLKVGVVNVPITYPPQPVNGFLISGLLTPPEATNFTYPAELRDELIKQVGNYQVSPRELHRKGNEQAYLDDLHHTLENHFKSTAYLMKNKPWDLFTVVFSETDWVMHAYWKYHDPTHPLHDPVEAKMFGNAIRSIYEHVDKVLASLLDLIDENTTIILMSDHGAGAAKSRSMINNWLLKIGLVKIKRNPISQFKYLLWRLGFTIENIFPLAVSLRLVTVKIKRKVDPRRMGRKSLIRRIFLSYNDVDWSKTKAYTMGGMGQIYINLVGRNNQGSVKPGEEYEQTCQYIADRLPEILLPGSKQPFVKRAFRRDELYFGEKNDLMPDIVILPTDLGYLDLGIEFFSNQMFTKVDAVTGGHRTNGVFILTGRNSSDSKELTNVSIRDIAPTALYLLGLPIPDDMDGRVLTEALDDNFVAEHPVRIERVKDQMEQDRQEGQYSEQEEELLRQRLANLGYL